MEGHQHDEPIQPDDIDDDQGHTSETSQPCNSNLHLESDSNSTSIESTSITKKKGFSPTHIIKLLRNFQSHQV